jgi:hypothetical protein
MLLNIYKQYFKINFINTFPNNNKYFIKFIDYFYNYNSLPKLHRWCNTTSPIYKDSCNWEKKIDNANRDNCYTNIN